MSTHVLIPPFGNHGGSEAALTPVQQGQPPVPRTRARRNPLAAVPTHLTPPPAGADGTNRHAELFYLQKQIHSQTPMVIVLEDGEQVEGYIEWYDRNCLKVRGRNKTLVYKSAIKYMFKVGEQA